MWHLDNVIGVIAKNQPQRNRSKRRKGRKSYPTICRANSYHAAKRRLPKLESHESGYELWL
ncbi:hypothetical protein NXW10_03055 [Bacteroides fragilis]|nr:hypothetical protein [Bacteroides xylanisolvens]UVO61750.1 hypothetical protein NXW10_03055 [Bacteroides fragilis]